MTFSPRHIGFALLACIVTAVPARASSETSICAKEVSAVAAERQIPAAFSTRLNRGVRQATALHRFHRVAEAAAKLDALVALLDGPRAQAMKPRTRAEVTTAIRALKTCLAAAEAPPLATLTIHTFSEDGTAEGGPGEPMSDGIYIAVEGIRIGRTGPDGTLQASVPSGRILIDAVDYQSFAFGEAAATVAPGLSSQVSVVLQDSKEPSEDSDLVIDEAPDQVLPAGGGSLTLRFVQDDVPVRVETIESVLLEDAPDQILEALEDSFKVRDGAMAAADPAAVYDLITKRSRIGRSLGLHVAAVDEEGRFFDGSVRFYVARSKLTVILTAPPSNPALPVSNIAVRVSVIGSDIALARVSDADGRFEVDPLPDATVALDAEAIAAGVHYYTHATVTMCADRLVTVPLLNVKDLVAGVRELVIDPSSPACPPVPRR